METKRMNVTYGINPPSRVFSMYDSSSKLKEKHNAQIKITCINEPPRMVLVNLKTGSEGIDLLV